MKQRLNHETRERTEEETFAVAEQSASFESVEAMIRLDAANTTVPPQLRDRLMRSIAREVRENKPLPWWKRWMPF